MSQKKLLRSSHSTIQQKERRRESGRAAQWRVQQQKQENRQKERPGVVVPLIAN